jgi:hypothetical protein
LIREGVLNGSGGPELVLGEEFNVDYQMWNGRHFVIGHPKDIDGKSISANDPAVIERSSVGQIFNVHPDGDALKGEVWVDLNRAPLIDGGQRIVSRLDSAEPLEVSTGYFRDVDSTPGERDGQPYQAIARNLRPDHLAALLDSKGACSWADGCGAPRTNEGGDSLEKSDQPNAILAAFSGLTELLRHIVEGKKEVTMTDKETIIADGRLGLNEAQVETLTDDAAATLVKSLATLTPCKDDVKANADADPEGDKDPGPSDVLAPDVIADITGLKETIAELSATVEQFRAAFSNIQANEEAEKAKIIAEVVAMETAFTEDQLKAMEVQSLDALRRSLRPADYSGRGGGPESTVGKREELAMPGLWATEKKE